VRTLVPVPKDVELTVSYTNLLETRAQRQLELSSKEFTCHCLRCDSPDSFPYERHLTTVHCPRCKRTPPRTAPAHQIAAGTCDYICRNEDGGCGALLKASELENIAATVAADIDAAIGVEGADDTLAARAAALSEVLRQNIGVTVAKEHALVIRGQMILSQLHDRSGFPYEAAASMAAAITAMRLLVPPGWPELVEVEERRGDLLLAAVSSFDKLDESEQPKLTVKRDLLVEGARALRRARTEVEVGAGLKHPLVPYLEFKASCAAKAAARHTKTINSSVEDD